MDSEGTVELVVVVVVVVVEQVYLVLWMVVVQSSATVAVLVIGIVVGIVVVVVVVVVYKLVSFSPVAVAADSAVKLGIVVAHCMYCLLALEKLFLPVAWRRELDQRVPRLS